MAREIKYRLWDKTHNIMSPPMEIYDIWQYHHPLMHLIPREKFNEDMVFLQYIGVKDKNGREIYERDIFRQKGMDGELIIGTIIYYDDLSYRCREGDYIFHKVKFAGEVIGNIYENPELLREE